VGILLVRGSLRTAATVRWFGIFFLAASSAMLIAWPTLQPIDLTLTEIRLNPGGSVGYAAFLILIFALLCWVVTELGRDPVQMAIHTAGLKRRDMRMPAVLGVVLVIGLGVSLHFFLGGESAQRAKSIAEEKMGLGYKLTVRSLSISGSGGATSVSGVVTAWNDKEVREIPVHWENRD